MHVRHTLIVLATSISALQAQSLLNDPMPTRGLTNIVSLGLVPGLEYWRATPIGWCSSAVELPQWATNNQNGDVSQYLHQGIIVGNGLNYLDAGGLWRPSEDLIEMTADGGMALLRAPTKVYFGSTLTNASATGIKIVTRNNMVFITRPLGVYYSDPSTGKEVLLATLQNSIAPTFQPPNRILYRSAFHSDFLEADLRVTCTKAAVECDTIITRQPKLSPTAFGMDPLKTLLQVRHAWISPAAPILSSRQLENGLPDTSIDFSDILFSPGRAFGWNSSSTVDTNVSAAITFFSFPPDENQEPVGKNWQNGTNGGPGILTESVLWSNAQPKLAQLPQMAEIENAPGAPAVPRSRMSPKGMPSRRDGRLAEASRGSLGFVVDWTLVTGSGDYTFQSYNGANTYFLTNNAVFNGTVTFNPSCIIKRTNGATLTVTGQIVCKGTCAQPSIITHQADNVYGEQISNNCASVDTAVALMDQVRGNPGNITGMNIRYAGTGIEFSSECSDAHTFKDSTLESCSTGIYAYNASVTILNSAVSSVTTPTSAGSCASFYGSWGSTCDKITLESAVVSGMTTLAQKPNGTVALYGGSGPTNFTYNNNCWIYGVTGYTAFSPWNSSGGGQGGAALITSRNALTVSAEHFGGSFAGATFTFVGKSGRNYQQYCQSHVDVTPNDNQSIGLLTFSTDLPSTDFDFLSLLPSTVTNKLTFDIQNLGAPTDGCLSKYLPCVAFNQDKGAYAEDLCAYNGADYSILTPSFWFPSYSYPYKVIPRGGDSGNPTFIIINNTIAYIGPWVYRRPDDIFFGQFTAGSSIAHNATINLGYQFSATQPLVIEQLSRFKLTNNSQSHVVSLLDTSGSGVPLAQSTVAVNGSAPGGWMYGSSLPYPLPTLSVGSSYYLVSAETNNQDTWYGWPGTRPQVTVGTINSAAASTDLKSFITYPGSSGQGFVPVNFYYFVVYYGWPRMAGASLSDINNALPQGYHVGTVDLSGFPSSQR